MRRMVNIQQFFVLCGAVSLGTQRTGTLADTAVPSPFASAAKAFPAWSWTLPNTANVHVAQLTTADADEDDMAIGYSRTCGSTSSRISSCSSTPALPPTVLKQDVVMMTTGVPSSSCANEHSSNDDDSSSISNQQPAGRRNDDHQDEPTAPNGSNGDDDSSALEEVPEVAVEMDLSVDDGASATIVSGAAEAPATEDAVTFLFEKTNAAWKRASVAMERVRHVRREVKAVFSSELESCLLKVRKHVKGD